MLNPELNREEMGLEASTLWAKSRLRDRIDAIVAHEHRRPRANRTKRWFSEPQIPSFPSARTTAKVRDEQGAFSPLARRLCWGHPNDPGRRAFGSILMSRLDRRRGAFALLVSTSLLAAAPADEPGFRPIFNGKDLTGWRVGKTDLAGKTASEDGRFAVKDGILVITGSKDRPPKNTEIDTVESYDGDFILRLEFRASRDANSGLHLRDKAFAHQLQIRDYPRVGPYKTLANYKDGDWNAIEVVVTGTKARCTCNGEVLEAALAIPGKGPLALQSEINVIEYRNIRIKTSNWGGLQEKLGRSSPDFAATAIASQLPSWLRLFQGDFDSAFPVT
jgi:hypothetical protein